MLAQNICNTHTKRHTPCTHIQTHTIYIYIYVHTLNHTTHVCIPYMLTPHTYTPLDTHTHMNHIQIHSPAHMHTYTPHINIPSHTANSNINQIYTHYTFIYTTYMHF